MELNSPMEGFVDGVYRTRAYGLEEEKKQADLARAGAEGN